MHGEDAAGDELSMLADAEMPRLYPHHVIEHELQVEPPFHAHLARAKGSGTRCQHTLPPCSPSPHPLGTHCTPGHPPRAWYKPNPRGCTNWGGSPAKRGCYGAPRAIITAWCSWAQPRVLGAAGTWVNMGLPCWVTMVHWSQSSETKLLWKDSLGCLST